MKHFAESVGRSITDWRFAPSWALVLMAYLGPEGRSALADWIRELSKASTSVLIGTWVISYGLLVKFIVSNKSGRLRQWVTDVRMSTRSAMIKVSSHEAVSRLRSSVAASSCARLLNLAGCALQHADRALIISAAEPFISLDLVATLNLFDLKDLFFYARMVNESSMFDREKFILSLRPPTRLALNAMDEVTAASRGGVPLSTSETGMDSLYYSAVMRIFAEWRSIRLIPKGSSQRYTLGMGMARRDLIQNIGKIEDAAHQWLLYNECTMHQRQNATERQRRLVESPTLQQLLEYEIKMKLHLRLPCLAEKSAASGLLWSKRQLQYQATIFTYTLQVPYIFPTTRAAITAAYKATYDDYHGFIVRQVFQSSFEAAPPAEQLFEHMSASTIPDEDSLTDDLTDSEIETDSSFVQIAVKKSTNMPRNVPTLSSHRSEGNPIEMLVSHFKRYICRGNDHLFDHQPSNVNNALHAVNDQQGDNMDKACNLMTMSSTFGVPEYLNITKSLLSELDSLIFKLNMNDPTKV